MSNKRLIIIVFVVSFLSLVSNGCAVLSPTPVLSAHLSSPHFTIKVTKPELINKTAPNPFVNEVIETSELEIRVNGEVLSDQEEDEVRNMFNSEVDKYFYNLRLSWFDSVISEIGRSNIFQEFSISPRQERLIDFELELDKGREFGQLGSGCLPELPILTLGIVPAICTRKYVISYNVLDRNTGNSFNFEYEYKSREVLGWIAYLLEIFPGWGDFFEHDAMHLDFGLEVKKKLNEIRSSSNTVPH